MAKKDDLVSNQMINAIKALIESKTTELAVHTRITIGSQQYKISVYDEREYTYIRVLTK